MSGNEDHTPAEAAREIYDWSAKAWHAMRGVEKMAPYQSYDGESHAFKAWDLVPSLAGDAEAVKDALESVTEAEEFWRKKKVEARVAESIWRKVKKAIEALREREGER